MVAALAMTGLSPVVWAQGGPGGIGGTDGTSNLQLWLRADAGVESTAGAPAAEGERIQFWRDQSGYGNDASQNTLNNRPVYRTDSMNSLPGIQFDPTDGAHDYLRMPNFMDFSEPSIILVGRNTTPYDSRDGMAFGVGGHNIRPKIQIRYHRKGFFWTAIDDAAANGWQVLTGVTNVFNISLHEIAGQTLTIRQNGGQLHRSTNLNYASPTFDGLNPPTIGVDSQLTGGTYGLEGDMLEVIVFDRPLNSAELRIVDNYLSSKYSIPLASGTVYTGSSAAKNNYDYDVFGFGRIDAANMVTSGAVGGLGLTAINDTLDDGEWLLAGHKVPVNGVIPDDLPGDVMSRWDRAWYLDHTGSVDTRMTFSFADAGLSAPDPWTVFNLLYSPVNDFEWTVLGENTWLSADGTVSFAVPGDVLASGYYTVGYILPEPTTGLLLLLSTSLLGLRRRR